MIEFKTFVGIDISKQTFDAALVAKNAAGIQHQCFSQSKEGVTAFLKWLKQQQVAVADTLICMEHTGLYTKGILHFLVEAEAHLWVEMAIKIKRSMGLQSGVDDKASSIVIAEYAMRFSDRVKLWKPVDMQLSKLRDLIAQRDRIAGAIKQPSVPIEEMKSCGASKQAKQLEQLQQPALTGLKKAKEKIEAAIGAFITSADTIHKSIGLMCSIKGIGLQTAASLYVYTKGFTMFENAGQLAC